MAVVEVNRPNRQLRRRHGKSDPVDAIAAARRGESSLLAGQRPGDGVRVDRETRL